MRLQRRHPLGRIQKRNRKREEIRKQDLVAKSQKGEEDDQQQLCQSELTFESVLNATATSLQLLATFFVRTQSRY
jgi:hypothetical protein